MPSADDLIPSFDDVEINPQRPSPPQQGAEGEFAWPSTVGKKSTKKKSKKTARSYATSKQEEGAANGFGSTVVAAPEAVAASPPDEQKDRLGTMEEGDTEIGWAQHEGQGRDVNENFQDGLPSQEPASAIVETEHAADSARSIQHRAPPPAPPSLSPRPAAAKPVYSSSLTPPSRNSMPQSPPSQYARANSQRANNNTSQLRRESNPPPRTSPHQFFVEPAAPPHMPQPHFYGLPDLGLGFGQKKEQVGKPPGSEGYCCCFDSLGDSGDLASARKARTALLVGSEGGLDVYRVLPNKVEVVGRLEGLRGGVIGAKILPAVSSEDGLAHLRPLVSVIVHGVVEEEDETVIDEGVTRYQTTVEVYSLQTQERVATLFATLPVVLEQPTIGHLSTVPRPAGDLTISAYGKFVTISSGKSGEVFVFSHVVIAPDIEPHFRCLGKFWTSLQSSLHRPTSRPASASEGSTSSGEAEKKLGVPLISLNQRWLALVPPATSTHISIPGTPLESPYAAGAPGLGTHVAPPQPSITCDIAGLDAEGAWSRITRQAAQGLVKYSQKGIEMGWQGWNELVNPTNQAGQQHVRGSSKDDQFPPTNAPPTDPSRDVKEPAVVSIVDLEALLMAEEMRLKYPPPPVATFALQDGCNHLCLSSTGLRLLTVSRKGEISAIWDLKQAIHGIVDYSPDDNSEAITGPCVKQVLQIPRSSQAIIVESAWSRDDEYLALLSNHGTVHLHEIPSRSSPRKRKRYNTPHTANVEKAQPTVGLSSGMSPPSNNASPSNFLGTLRSGFQSVGSQVSSIRSSQPAFGMPTLAGLRETAASAGQAGSRALARGLSQGYSAARSGATDYFHADDNKIRHKALQGVDSTTGVLRWVKRQSGTLLAVAAGGSVHLHPVTREERRRGDEIVGGLKHDRFLKKTFELPPIRTGSDAVGYGKRPDECSRAGPHGFWSLRLSNPTAPPKDGGEPLEQSHEVETNPPYCPFHVDSRVSVCAFDESSGSQILISRKPSSVSDPRNAFLTQGRRPSSTTSPWVFGDPLPSSTKMNPHEELNFDDEFHDDALTDGDMDAHMDLMERSQITVKSAGDGAGEEIHVHTRMVMGRGGMEDVDLSEA